MFFLAGAFFLVGFLCVGAAKTSRSPIPKDQNQKDMIDRAQAVALDANGQVYVTGYSYDEETNYDFVTLKYDQDGRLLWVARYDGPASSSDYALALAVDTEGNAYVAGTSNGAGTSLDVALIKYNSSGKEQWTARYDGPSHRDDYALALTVDAKDNVYVMGNSFGSGTEHDYITLKYDSQGKEIWEARYNSPMNRDDTAAALGLDTSGSVYVTGTDRTRATSYDFATLKYDHKGKEAWLARYHGQDAYFDSAQALVVDASGQVYVTGCSYSEKSAYDFVTVKYDSQGRQLWIAKYNGPANRIDMPNALAVDRKGNVYVTGKSLGEDSAFDCSTIKYDDKGRQLWVARFNGSGNGADVPSCISLDPDSNIIVTGFSWGGETERDFLTMKYDAGGKLLWKARYNGPANGADVPKSMALDAQGNICVTGYSDGGKTGFDYLTIQYDSDGHKLWEARYVGQKR